MTTPLQDRDGWLCCHLGAREHYAIPRALHRRGRLRCLATDAWAVPGEAWTRVPGGSGRRLGERYSADLGAVDVRDFTSALIAHELWWRARGLFGWTLAIARNTWFQERAAEVVREVTAPVVFAHSYAALEPFREAKRRGYRTVLGQIDPGQRHFQLVDQLQERWPDFGPAPAPPPPEYFAAWREECELADTIVVNSQWSGNCLEQAGISRDKLKVVPLAYEPLVDEAGFVRSVPRSFTADRPMRVLFAGSVAVYKGIPSLLAAMDRLTGLPIVLRVVGELAAVIPERFRQHRAIEWIGPVSRSDVMAHCRESDVLVFPSHSDGFGMVQVEAQGWQLPIIASPFCGQVVSDGVNGLVLSEVSADAIAAALRRVAETPALLARFASHTGANHGDGLDQLGAALLRLETAATR